jgi:hypothetical protein
MTENDTTGSLPATVECAVCKKLIPSSEGVIAHQFEGVLPVREKERLLVLCGSIPPLPVHLHR